MVAQGEKMSKANEVYQRNRHRAILKILKILQNPMVVMSPAKAEALILVEEYGITSKELIETWDFVAGFLDDDPGADLDDARIVALTKVLCNVRNKMAWRTGQPTEADYYLCAIVGNNRPSELYWDGSQWSYLTEYDGLEYIDNDEVPYYMELNDIPMPEGW